jgi:uncharacterized protein YsxB (DUF464 family)
MVGVRAKGISIDDGGAVYSGSPVVSLEISGHAFYAEKGSDIVCAGVSVLQQTLARTLAVRKIPFRLGNEDASVIIQCDWQDFDDRQRGLTLGAFEMAIYGLMMMAESYPDHLEITFE